MPVYATDGSSTITDLSASGVACSRPRTPEPAPDGVRCDPDALESNSDMAPPAGDNTAAGMSMLQEDSMYVEEEKADLESPSKPSQPDASEVRLPDTPKSLDGSTPTSTWSFGTTKNIQNAQLRTPSPDIPSPSTQWPGASSVDDKLNRHSEAQARDFTRRSTSAQYPSSLFQVGSKYVGTQQSDRQIYNVEVTVLTVDMEQCTISGYLEICGLTPDHPTLTTFFTGEIIGGPDQKYSFRTKDSTWGASDKTDMTHWARFPAWRSLSSHAKLDMDFVHPIDHSSWSQQEHIFMRWKEHFLVPDYKLRSIQGASFEGFYYICLNQVDGKISGIYFHSKSEK